MDRPRTIELCGSDEWLYTFGPLSDLGPEHPYLADACAAWRDAVIDGLTDLFPDVALFGSRGVRATCHGWNGYRQFARFGSGLGTFDQFTDDEWAKATAIAIATGQRLVEEYCAQLVSEEEDAASSEDER